jgi:hypothetical protein
MSDKDVAAKALLSLAKDYEKTLVYYINVDKKNGDYEGVNLKGITLYRVREIIKTAEAAGIECAPK